MERYAMLLDWKNIVEMAKIPKAIHIFKAIPSNFPWPLYVARTNNPKIHMEP